MVINLSTMYATKDTVELFVNKRIANSTILHHIGVICAYLYCLSVLTTSEFNTEGIFKNFIVYAGFALSRYTLQDIPCGQVLRQQDGQAHSPPQEI